ncbi:hypothetical protein [Bradyrhizobium uaiense]|uniref:Uncharacterized protein n=1 Tax=Bradyrhizobium uaiense TaxID=2594946 RepID=A0A6P1BT48_9BRAD|nr:hypothetical protein [Bradyrhizobium uaiense]NEV01354.1 hypothetical protein [Bradyrhizobium uaiense]
MVYKFDPIHFDGTIFDLDETSVMVRGCYEFLRRNEPIPASYFPKKLTFQKATDVLPDMFHMSRDFLVFSERARGVIEDWAPGQIEFIPVACDAKPRIAATLSFDSAYYFVNILGRAQRILWYETPSRPFGPQDDGVERFGLTQNFHKWRLRDRSPGEPLIWHEEWWRDGNKEYRGHSEVLVDDALWRQLDANFPDQLHPMQADDD